MRCVPEGCEKNPMNTSRGMRDGFANQHGTCADCRMFLLKRPFLKHEIHTSTPEEFKAKLFALASL